MSEERILLQLYEGDPMCHIEDINSLDLNTIGEVIHILHQRLCKTEETLYPYKSMCLRLQKDD